MVLTDEAIQNIGDLQNENIRYSDVVMLMKMDPTLLKPESLV